LRLRIVVFALSFLNALPLVAQTIEKPDSNFKSIHQLEYETYSESLKPKVKPESTISKITQSKRGRVAIFPLITVTLVFVALPGFIILILKRKKG